MGKGPEYTFPWRYTKVNRYMKRHSALLIIRKCKSKPRDIAIVRVAIITKIKDNKCRQRCGEKGTLTHSWRMQIGVATMENSMAFSQEFKNRTAYDSAILLLGIYVKELK